jgi:flagellar basal-body rod protein FlgG
LGTGGAIRLPPGKVSVLPDGRIFAGGAYVDTLKMVDFADTHVLRKTANNAFEADASVQTIKFNGVIQAGFLEDSNVNPIREMVKMISVSRVFEANQKMITMHDTTLGRAVSDIARK